MNWQNINVFQWQQMIDILGDKNVDSLDSLTKLAAIVTNKTENEIDSLPFDKLNSIIKDLEFIQQDLQGKPEKFINVNGRRYRCIYDVRKIPAARYIETKHFGADVKNNLHRIMACMVMPQKRNWFGKWVDDNYNAADHDAYAQDMLSAPIVSVYGSVVFFYHVFKNWMLSSRDYLIKEMMETMTKEEAEKAYTLLCESMDGFISQNSLQNMKESDWKKYMN